VHDFRACVRHSHPGYYFQVLVPATVLCLAGGAIAGWNRPRARNRWAIVALAGVLAAELFTVAYFFPRNAVLFFDPLDRSTAQALASAAIEWRNAHFLRMAMLAAGVLGALRALLQGPAPRQE
jgi:NAD(P)H-dependent FMN reductase